MLKGRRKTFSVFFIHVTESLDLYQKALTELRNKDYLYIAISHGIHKYIILIQKYL